MWLSPAPKPPSNPPNDSEPNPELNPESDPKLAPPKSLEMTGILGAADVVVVVVVVVVITETILRCESTVDSWVSPCWIC